MDSYKPVMPHGEIEEVFPEVFFVTGTTRPVFQGVTWQFSRNMTIIREDDRLTLVNTVRLDDAGLAALDTLGKVTSVVKLGSFHGMDDAFYVDRYGASLWALPGMIHESGKATTDELVNEGAMPVSGAALFVFETSAQPEGLLLLDRAGGILIACDSLQNWIEPDQYFDEQSAKMMSQAGFFAPANVGPGWRQASNPRAGDFSRLLDQLSFAHLLSAHGVPLRDSARTELTATFVREFGI